MPKMRQTRFVILGIQRTGTILLVNLLDSHPDAVCLGELFQHRADRIQYSVPRYQLSIQRSAFHHVLGLLFEGYAIRKYLHNVFSSFEVPVMGFKLMLDQAQRHPAVLAYLKKNGFRVVQITRENLLKTHLSRLRARQTGVYVSADQAPANKLVVPADSLLDDLEALAIENATLENLVQDLDLDHTNVVYERLAGEEHESELPKLLAFLGLEADIRLQTKTVKLTPDDLRMAVMNYDELVAVLKESPHERFLSS
jgi:LPS sulfotransferase NodH